MNSEIVSALISFAGVVVSSAIAWGVSHTTANREIDKLHLTWRHEDVVSSDDEFAEMSAAVARYIHGRGPNLRLDATAKVAAIRAKETGDLGACLDELYEAISGGDAQKMNSALTEVIEEKRKSKGSTEAS